MNYYHASRFDYGTARLLLKLQYFLDEGTALQRVSKRVEADFRILAEERGSWIRKVLDFTTGKSKGDASFGLPLSVLLTMLNNRMSKKGILSNASEQIRQMNVVSDDEKRVRQQLIDNVSKFPSHIYSEQKKYIEEQEHKVAELGPEYLNLLSQVREYREVLETLSNGEETVREHWSEASKIEDSDLDKLMFVNKSAMQDMVHPIVNNSVDRLYATNDNNNVKVVFNRKNSEAYFGESIDKIPTTYEGRIKNLDFETGWGKYRTLDFYAPIGFQIPRLSMKRDLQVLSEAANKEGKVKLSFFNVKDVNGNVIRLIYNAVVDI